MEKAYKDNKIVEEMGHVTEISLKEKIKETEGTKCIMTKKKKPTMENNIRKKRQDKREK